jgi:hypothetical protein
MTITYKLGHNGHPQERSFFTFGQFALWLKEQGVAWGLERVDPEIMADWSMVYEELDRGVGAFRFATAAEVLYVEASIPQD